MATSTNWTITFISICGILVVLFSLAIGFDISPLLRGPAPYPPEWQWAYNFTNTSSRLWAPLLVGLLGLGGFAYFDTRKKVHTILFLVVSIFFLLVLQLSILYFSRAGVGVLLERIINPGISGYFTTALSIHGVGIFLSSFQQHVPDFPMRAADHPPFAVLFFSLILYISQHMQLLFPLVEKVTLRHMDIATLWNHLLPFQKLGVVLSALIVPLLSAMVILPLYFFTKLYYDTQSAIRACFLYSIFPSVSLFLPLNDVFLGIFGMTGFLLLFLGKKRKSVYLYFFSGVSFVVGIFFSVSMVVPLVMAMVMYAFLPRTKLDSRGMGGFLAGLGSIPVIALFFHFNTFAVFVEITRAQAQRSYLPWVFYNLYDFFIFSGIPILVSCIYLLADKVRSKRFFTPPQHALTISFFLVLAVLDISGLSRAETGRIWMPYMPILASIIGAYFTREKKVSTHTWLAIFVLQLLQLVVMQEFWVTLW